MCWALLCNGYRSSVVMFHSFHMCWLQCRRSVASRAMSDKIEIDITSDTVCPWCYIGKRRLEKAIEELQVSVSMPRCTVKKTSLAPLEKTPQPMLSRMSMWLSSHLLGVQGEGKLFEVRWHPFQLNPGACTPHDTSPSTTSTPCQCDMRLPRSDGHCTVRAYASATSADPPIRKVWLPCSTSCCCMAGIQPCLLMQMHLKRARTSWTTTTTNLAPIGRLTWCP